MYLGCLRTSSVRPTPGLVRVLGVSGPKIAGSRSAPPVVVCTASSECKTSSFGASSLARVSSFLSLVHSYWWCSLSSAFDNRGRPSRLAHPGSYRTSEPSDRNHGPVRPLDPPTCRPKPTSHPSPERTPLSSWGQSRPDPEPPRVVSCPRDQTRLDSESPKDPSSAGGPSRLDPEPLRVLSGPGDQSRPDPESPSGTTFCDPTNVRTYTRTQRSDYP